MANDFLLACLNPPRAWNFYPTLEAAEAAAPEVNAREGTTYAPMTWEEYEAGQRAFYVTGELTEITEARWFEMLEVLPPEAWVHKDGVERFRMMEYLTGSITEQFAKRHGRFFCRNIDTADKSTWITGAEIDAHIAKVV